MSTLIKDLGAVSAYAYAVEKGYTGTEDDFASLMYDYTDVIQIASEARDGAVAANASAQEAKAEAQTASDTANEAASKATSKASEASASVTEAGKATNAAVAAKTAAETAQQRAETAQQASEDAQRKAEIAKNEAQENATIANSKANKASQYATTANNKASEASTSAKNAKTYSEQAQASATTANTKADEASASANAAEVSADNAQQSATNAQTYMDSSSTSASKAQANAEKTQSDKEAVESAKSDALSAVDSAQNYANSAQSASQAIQNMSVEATTLEPDSDATVEKTVDAISGTVTLTYGIPKGQVGEKGDKGNTGDSGVYIGASAPLDENVKVWIDSDGEPDIADIQIDPTLTQSGQAADAKMVGDALAGVKADVSDIQTAISTEVKSKNLINPDALTVGRLSSSGITDTMSIYKTSDYILLDVGEYVFAREKLSDGSAMATGYSGYGFYDLNKTWIADSRVWDNWTAGTVLSFTVSEKCYIRVSGNKDYFIDDSDGLFILQRGTALDGYEAYYEPQREYNVIKKSDIEQTAGESETKLMSQKAIKEFVEVSAGGDLDEIAPYIVGKNKYNPAECNPQNYMYYNASGTEGSATNYAITGKIPVESETGYIFSSTILSMQYSQVCYFAGENGEMFISKETINGAPFTTPENCTYIGMILFGRTHTDQDFTDAIAVAQLELGNIVTAYEPYSEKRMVSPSNILGGENIEALGEVTETQSQINLYDKNLAVDGKYLYGKTNTIQSSENYAYSGRIPVKPNRQYNISIDPTSPLKISGVVFTFDANGNKLANASLSNYVYSYLLSFATGADVSFISFNMSKDAHTTQEFEDTINTLMLCYGTLRPLTYSAYNAESVIDVSKLSDAYVANRDCFSGKKWLATGTSITWYDGKTYSAGVHTGEICRGYIGRVSHRKHLLVTNEGISGSTLANVSDSSLINRYTSLDWANTDIATIEYGVNDFGHAVEIGTAEDPAGTNTFAACLKTVIEYALAQNPAICLVICTEPDVRGNTANTGGHYLKEYTDVTLAIAEQYRLPVCDWYYKSGINSLNKGDSSTDKMTADGTHPNDKGHMRMGAMLNQVFDSLLC